MGILLYMKILICITGGTIDSYWDGTKDTVVPHEASVIPKFLESLKSYHDFECETICMKDSREITQEDMNTLLEVIEDTEITHILVTHGTYTMSDTGRFLSANLQEKNKTIIITGSMLPLEFPNSDAQFNIGYSIASMNQLDSGVHICMNGKIFTPEEISKAISDGRFVSLYNK